MEREKKRVMKSNSRSIQCYKVKLKRKSIKKGPKKPELTWLTQKIHVHVMKS